MNPPSPDVSTDHPRPLALYYFDYNRERVDRALRETIAGGVTINGTISHIAQDELPFGGVAQAAWGITTGQKDSTPYLSARVCSFNHA